jgi:hypothetical protein
VEDASPTGRRWSKHRYVRATTLFGVNAASLLRMPVPTTAPKTGRAAVCPGRLSAVNNYLDQLFARADLDFTGSLKFEEFLPIADEVMRAMGPSSEVNAAS